KKIGQGKETQKFREPMEMRTEPITIPTKTIANGKGSRSQQKLDTKSIAQYTSKTFFTTSSTTLSITLIRRIRCNNKNNFPMESYEDERKENPK
ncbi:MAG: hypothetical protein EZS28_050995, partial [Streblomastix strix]